MSTDVQPQRGGLRALAPQETAPGVAGVQAAVAATRRGDRNALGVLYQHYAATVYAHVLGIVRNPHDAEDLTQHVFAKLITAIERYEPTAAPFSAWLMRVSRNAALDHLRHGHDTPCEEVTRGAAGDQEAIHERRMDIRRALEALPGHQREVVVLRHLVGLTPAEIADWMGRSEPSIHGLHHRARATLRARLTELGAAPRTPLARVA